MNTWNGLTEFCSPIDICSGNIKLGICSRNIPCDCISSLMFFYFFSIDMHLLLFMWWVAFRFLNVLFAHMAFQSLLSVSLSNKKKSKIWDFFPLVNWVDPNLQHFFFHAHESRARGCCWLYSPENLCQNKCETSFAVHATMEGMVLDSQN